MTSERDPDQPVTYVELPPPVETRRWYDGLGWTPLVALGACGVGLLWLAPRLWRTA